MDREAGQEGRSALEVSVPGERETGWIVDDSRLPGKGKKTVLGKEWPRQICS
ncbi:MAG: hypothetical protein HPY59_16240 [Anaerolineae bacterium]|nr:hypothetical protein [Anaerolineae bacterium]